MDTADVDGIIIAGLLFDAELSIACSAQVGAKR